MCSMDDVEQGGMWSEGGGGVWSEGGCGMWSEGGCGVRGDVE